MNFMNPPKGNEAVEQIDFLGMGEALVDFISNEYADGLANTAHFTRFAGGQVANLTANMARLGKRAALAACVGQDGLGRFIRSELAKTGVLTDLLQETAAAPTTIVVVGKQTTTPDFIIYRGADAHLEPAPAVLQQAAASRVVHTSAFALARDPARSTILAVLRAARAAGARVSFDPNYHPRVWPDIPHYAEVVGEMYPWVDVIKPSIEDCTRLVGPGFTPEEYVRVFLRAGVQIVLLSMGAEGVLVADQTGLLAHIPSAPLKVVDVTGAGDAFWSGFLSAWMDGAAPLEAACAGQAIAEYKIGMVGPIQHAPDGLQIKDAATRIHQRVVFSVGTK